MIFRVLSAFLEEKYFYIITKSQGLKSTSKPRAKPGTMGLLKKSLKSFIIAILY
jgi:hypothetical protein